MERDLKAEILAAAPRYRVEESGGMEPDLEKGDWVPFSWVVALLDNLPRLEELL